MTELPTFYNDLQTSFEKIWAILAEGAANRRVAAHVPVVATIDADGHPTQRVMILREADYVLRRLRFHTDARSIKAGEIAAGGQISVLIYDIDQKIQLRIGGVARLDTVSNEADAAWQQSTPFARRCYMAEHAPGDISDEPTSGLPADVEGRQPTEAELAEFRSNFAALWVDVTSIDYLYLANAGHRRAKWRWDGIAQSWSANWLVP